MDNTHILKEINFVYWNSKNPYFSDKKINSSVRGMLTLVQNAGFLKNFWFKSNLDIVNSIFDHINSFNINYPDDEILLTIFDLIQVWGGITGRRPYIKDVKRRDIDYWKKFYFEGVNHSLKDDPRNALKNFCSIPGVGASFAPKHLRFWSNKYPILDTRISLILCGNTNLLKINKNNVSKYDDFISLINILAEQFNTKSILDVEKALFAFSKNFFLNDKLTLNKNIEDKTDTEIAKKLSINHIK